MKTQEVLEERIRREKLLTRGLVLWQDHAKRYRTIRFEYLFLLEEKRQNKLCLHRLTAKVLEDFPSIPLFDFWSIDDARAYLEDIPPSELLAVIEGIETTISQDYVYNTLINWVADAKYVLRRHYAPTHNNLAIGVSNDRKWPNASSGTRSYHYVNY